MFVVYHSDLGSSDHVGERNRNIEEWFLRQIKTLRAWNLYDPPDENERRRTERIANVQGNVNPFVLDHTLVEQSTEVVDKIFYEKLSFPLNCDTFFDFGGTDHVMEEDTNGSAMRDGRGRGGLRSVL